MAEKILYFRLAILGGAIALLNLVNTGIAASDRIAQPGIQTRTGQIFVEGESTNFNLQIQAIEVTQGVRGDIPTRVPPDGDLTLLPDGAVHIANRRTVVRAYPWIENYSDTVLPPITARLWAYRDGVLLPGSPLSPQNQFLLGIAPEGDFAEMRSDAEKSWNFLLPPAWIASDPDFEFFTLRFLAEVNPTGPDHQLECQGCADDNKTELGGQGFVTVPTLVIQPYFVEHTLQDRDGTLVTFSGPSIDEFDKVMRFVHAVLPVGDFDRGLVILPPIHVEWQGLLYENERHIFAETMIREYLPGGILKENQGDVTHLFVFNSAGKHKFLVNYNSDGMRIGMAWTSKPYAQGGARGLELVHELTHTIGLSHAGNHHGETTTNPDYPDPTGRVESNAYGFHIWKLQAIPPFSKKGDTHDFMSYNSLDPAWVSIYTWKTIGDLLGQPNLDV